MSQEEFVSKHPRAAELYASEHSYFLGWKERTLEDAEKDGLTIVTHDAMYIKAQEGAESVRHDPVKLAEALKEILPK
jgi:hypothetical protein